MTTETTDKVLHYRVHIKGERPIDRKLTLGTSAAFAEESAELAADDPATWVAGSIERSRLARIVERVDAGELSPGTTIKLPCDTRVVAGAIVNAFRYVGLDGRWKTF